MDKITVREATPEDLENILNIAERGWNSAYSDFLSRETIDTAMAEWYGPNETREQIRREDIAYLVAERNDNIIGYICGGPSERENVAYLSAIYVDPDYWANGAGTALLEEFEAFCRGENYDRIQFRVLAENEVGKSFYERQGYEVIEKQETEVFGESTREYVYSGTIGEDLDFT